MGISYSTAKRWFRSDVSFQNLYNAYRQEWLSELEIEYRKRALAKSDILLIFMLKSLAPERYDDQIRKARFMEREQIDNASTEVRVEFVDAMV